MGDASFTAYASDRFNSSPPISEFTADPEYESINSFWNNGNSQVPELAAPNIASWPSLVQPGNVVNGGNAWLNGIKIGLDVASIAPGPVGTISNLLSAGIDLAQGNYTSAAISVGGAVLATVGLGVIVKGVKLARAARAARTAEALAVNAAKTGENLVYRSLNVAGGVNYVGITGNLERRAAEHLAEKGINIKVIPGLQNLSRADARAVEQVLIESHGLGKNGGTLLNKINSISRNNQIYQQSIQRGKQLLRQVGYPGF